MEAMAIHRRTESYRPPAWRIAGGIVCLAALAFLLCVASGSPTVAATSGRANASLQEYVLRFERSYQGVRTLKANFTQSSFAWGRRRVESGTVYMEQGGKMRWEYREPEPKLFLSTGKELLLYIPQEKQLTVSPIKGAGNVQVPLTMILSRLDLNKIFSRIEFADQALKHDPGDRVLRGVPRSRYRGDYSGALIELTPNFDIRRLVVLYADNSTMQFDFSDFHRNVSVDGSLFAFNPPPGTEIIHQ
jgi:outer membrane lipoprotein carrier protein